MDDTGMSKTFMAVCLGFPVGFMIYILITGIIYVLLRLVDYIVNIEYAAVIQAVKKYETAKEAYSF